MTPSRELLMRYLDGEVSEAEAREVESALDQEPALAEELEAYSELGSFLRAFSEVEASKPFDVSGDVMAAIEAEPARAPVRAPARVQSLLPRIATWVSLGAAIAAGSVLVARSWSAPPAPSGPSAAHAPVAAERASAAAAASAVAPPELAAALQAEEESKLPPATIESVDFGSNAGSVFVVSTDSSETPVVWMPDDGEPDEDNEDRSESL